MSKLPIYIYGGIHATNEWTCFIMWYYEFHLKLCVILGIPLFLFPGYNGKSKVPEFIYGVLEYAVRGWPRFVCSYCVYIWFWCHETNSCKIDSHVINTHEINSHKINFSRDQLTWDQLLFTEREYTMQLQPSSVQSAWESCHWTCTLQQAQVIELDSRLLAWSGSSSLNV